jgi:outer membrane protein TolC
MLRSYRTSRLAGLSWLGMALVAQAGLAAEPAPASAGSATPTAAPASPAVASSTSTVPTSAPLTLEGELGQFIQPGALTSLQVAEKSVASSARIGAKHQAVLAAEAAKESTAMKFIPQLSLSARYTRLSEIKQPSFGGADGVASAMYIGDLNGSRLYNPAEDTLMLVPSEPFSFPVILDQVELKATLSIPVSDYLLRLSSAVGAANHAKYMAEWNEKAEALLIAVDSKVGYYNWVRALGSRFIAEKAVAQVEAALRDVQGAFSVGTASRADVLRVEGQLRSAKLMLARASQGVELAASSLRTLQHDAADVQYAVGENVLADVVVPETGSLDEALAEAKAHRLELRALEAVEESYRSQIALTRADMFPRLDVQANAVYANPNQRIIPATGNWDGTWDASVVLSWTPTAIPDAMARIENSKAKIAEYTAQREALLDGLRMELAQAQSAMTLAVQTVQTSREALATAEEGYRVRRELFSAGRATTLEVTDAQNVLTQARLELLFAHLDARIAKEKLLHALGRDVVGPKSP